MTYDINLIIHNINEISKKKNIQIGKLEKAIDVSPGYFSRFRNNNNSSNPGIDKIISVCNVLGVSLDELCFIDHTNDKMTNDEFKLNAFINLIINLTKENKLQWNLIKIEDLMKSKLISNINQDYMKFIDFDSSITGITKIRYKSLYESGFCSFDIVEGLAYFDYNECRYYLNMVKTNKTVLEKIYYEFYLVKKNELYKICSTYNNDINQIVCSIQNLYTEAINNISHTKLDNQVDKEINRFLSKFKNYEMED